MDVLKIIESNNLVLQEYNLLAESGENYWHSNFLDKNGFSVASGFGDSINVSRKIAFSEFLERSKFNEIKLGSDELRQKWGFSINSMGCGFAAGFDLKNTVNRSLSEGVERWVMSKWIDEGLHIEQLNSKCVFESLDDVSKWFCRQFDTVLFFEKTIVVEFFNVFHKIKVGFSMGLKAGGIYPGSSAQVTGGSVWQHALLESYRHLLVVKNSVVASSYPENRIRFFSKNAAVALAKLDSAKNKKWPDSEILFHECEAFQGNSYFVARTILKGWSPWNLGPVERFLY
ncbi:MAG: hypothetical protein H7235_09565 [Bdellovibrionaceae bacterium]|nr:hypothetical protein [Pseudobdellovibrionaceae bacterium]